MSKAKYRKDYKPFPYEVENGLNLKFQLEDDKAIVTSVAQYTLKDGFKKGEPLVLNGKDMASARFSVKALDGSSSPSFEFEMTDEALTIYNPPESLELTVTAEIHPETNTSNEGLYRESADIGSTFLTQCEAEGFRKITYFPDRPDVMTKYTVRIEAEKAKYPYLLSNGDKVDSGDLPDGRHFAVWEDPWKKPCYLFALVAGDLYLETGSFTTAEGRSVSLEVYVDHANAGKGAFAIESLRKSMKWDEERFGRCYDLNTYMIVATDRFNMGAMENKGLNVFNSKYVLAHPATTTDAGYIGIEAVIGHEYFHNWTGNRITCRDWFQLTLKEGLTVYRDEEFTSDMQDRTIKRIEDVQALRNAQFPEDAGPMAHPIRPDEVQEMNNFYTSTVYNKGAMVIRMIETIVGKDGFRKGMDLYFDLHDGEAVTCDDFVAAIADANGVDLTQFRDTWYTQAGTPRVTVSWEYNPVEETFTLKVKQSCSPTPGQDKKKPFHMPLVLGLLDKNGNDMPLESENPAFEADKSLLHITKASHKFVFKNVKSEPVPSLFRDFSAPINLDAPYLPEELLFLMKHDSNTFNRYDAANSIAVEQMKKMVNGVLNGGSMTVDAKVVDAYKPLLEDAKAGRISPAVAAEMLRLPAPSYVGGLMPKIHIELLEKAREMLKKAIADAYEGLFADIYKANYSDAVYVFSKEEVARRSLVNTCLSYLMETGNANADALHQFKQAHTGGNMTDSYAALTALVNCETASAEAEEALNAFYATWKDDSEVMDKWFSVQASSSKAGTLAKVKELLKHPAYDITKPNKVRSVIGMFAGSGYRNFHNADGSGYDFMADYIIGLDKVNPQVASWMVGVLMRWKQMDDIRSQLMKAALEKIKASGKLSDDVSEKVEKALV